MFPRICSDHGYHLGQYRVPCEKQQIWETDIHVPFYMRGPGITAGSTTDKLIGNVDIYPTILDLAGVSIPESVDGKSAKEVIMSAGKGKEIEDAVSWREIYMSEFIAYINIYFDVCTTWYPAPNGNFKGVLVHPSASQWTNESSEVLALSIGDGFNPGDTWRLIRILNETVDWTYSEFIDYHWNETSFEQPYLSVLYDNEKDKYQLKNVFNEQSKKVQNELHQMLMTYGKCKGSQCP